MCLPGQLFKSDYVPAPLRVFLLLISSEDLDAPLVLLAGVASGEAVFCRTDLLVVTSPTDSLLDTEVPLNLSFPTVTAAVAAVVVLGCLVVNKRLSLCTLLLALKFDILLELI